MLLNGAVKPEEGIFSVEEKAAKIREHIRKAREAKKETRALPLERNPAPK